VDALGVASESPTTTNAELHEHGRRLAAAVEYAAAHQLLEIVLDLDYGDVELSILECDRFVGMFDTAGDDQAIVDEHGDELAELTLIDDRDGLLRWITIVRPKVLKRLEDGMNQAEAYAGGRGTWHVVADRLVDVEGGIRHRDLIARAPRAVAVRPRTRTRSRRRRSAATSRARARSPGDRSDDPEPDQLDVLEAAA
jgi:hypothetical protein